MEEYHTSLRDKPRRDLSRPHRRMLFEESGIDPQVAAERGYYSARSRTDVPEVFKDYQRRLGLVVPVYGLDGTTYSYHLRPDKPRKPKLKYESPAGSRVILDAHPRCRAEVNTGTGDLFVVEGVKKADCLLSRGAAAVSLTGVWMAHVPKTNPKELLPCWNHVRLKGRRVLIVFDSDWRHKEGVHGALEWLAGALEARGADVRVGYLEDNPDGSKVGADDYLSSGKSVSELKALCRRFEAVNIGTERLKRDERLGLAVEDIHRKIHARHYRTKGEYSARSIMRYLVSIAPERGKLTPEGLRIEASKREIADGACISARTVSRCMTILENPDAPLLRRDNLGRDPKKRGAFVLFTTAHQGGARYCPHKGEKQRKEGNEAKEREGRKPLVNAAYGPRGDTNARDTYVLASDAVPELRWPTLSVSRERDELRGGWKLTYTYQDRLAKKRQAIVEALVDAGGELLVDTLVDRFGTKGEKARPRDFRRRTLAPLVNTPHTVELETVEGKDRHTVKRQHTTRPGPPVIEMVQTPQGAAVRLLRDWREALEEHRRISGELDAARLQKEKHRRQSEAFRHPDRDKHDTVPDMHPIDDLRQAFAFHPEGCACRACSNRFGQWISPHVNGCACVDCFSARKQEQSAGVLPLPSRVASPAAGWPQPERETAPATVVPILREAAKAEKANPPKPNESEAVVRMPEKVDGIYHHDAFCDCDWCDAPLQPSYARVPV